MPVDGMLNACTLSFKSSPSDSEELIPLAGYLVILAQEDASKGVFLFNPHSGLEWFDDQTSLKHHCRGLLTRGDRPGSITPDDWNELQQAPPHGISMTVIDGGIFPAVADSLIVLVKRRLAHALRYPGAQSSTACAAVEDALDIRNLIDVRLGKLGNSARWPRTADEEVLPGLPVLPSKSLTLAERAAHGQSLPALLRSLKSTQPDVRTVAKDLLSPAISVLSDGMLRPEQIQVKTANRSTSLVEYFLERLCSNHAEDPSKRIEALDQSGLPLSWLDIDAIRKQVNSLTLTFSSYYLTRLNEFDRGQVRLGNCRTNGLSINTHPHFLFKTYDNFAWRDIRRNDGRALPVIFRLTGKRDLDEARQAFYSDPQVRTDIILANADSLALLISRLGRRRFAPAG